MNGIRQELLIDTHDARHWLPAPVAVSRWIRPTALVIPDGERYLNICVAVVVLSCWQCWCTVCDQGVSEDLLAKLSWEGEQCCLWGLECCGFHDGLLLLW